MKTTSTYQKQRLISAIILLSILIPFASCKKDDTDDIIVDPVEEVFKDGSCQIHATGDIDIDLDFQFLNQESSNINLGGVYDDGNNDITYIMLDFTSWQLDFSVVDNVSSFQTGIYELDIANFFNVTDNLHYLEIVSGSVEITEIEQDIFSNSTYTYSSGNFSFTSINADGDEIDVTGDFENVMTLGDL